MLFFNENDRHCLDFIRTTPPPPRLFIFFACFFDGNFAPAIKKKDGFKNQSLHQTYQKTPVVFTKRFFRIFRIRNHVSNKLTWSCHGEVQPRRAAFKVAAKGQDVTVMQSEELEGFLRKKIFCPPKNPAIFPIRMFPKIGGFPPKSSIKKYGFPLFSPSIFGIPLLLETPILGCWVRS